MKHALGILAHSKPLRAPALRAERRRLHGQLVGALILALAACVMLVVVVAAMMSGIPGVLRWFYPPFFLCAAIGVALEAGRTARRIEPQLIAEHICPNCGYPLVQRGSDGLLCTECGLTAGSPLARTDSPDRGPV